MASREWSLEEMEHVLDQYKVYGKENIAGFLNEYKKAWPELKQPARATFVSWLGKSGTSNAPAEKQQSISQVLAEAKGKLNARKAQLEKEVAGLQQKIDAVKAEMENIDQALTKL
ncbi:hypothetical protein [Pseudomonas sp. UBA2684]|uniref:hypothetical protein n=1 Tax=Pseudomonas sp. UBA2684 TaxID=1947311 RepID=UPI0025E57155|nr:hypothetical protein [Pseudomonas sp. UBA2684]